MNRSTKNANVDLRAKCDELYGEFYNAGMKYIIALNERIETDMKELKSAKELTVLRERKRLLVTCTGFSQMNSQIPTAWQYNRCSREVNYG